MGIAALDFISCGAENTDKIIELVCEYFNQRELMKAPKFWYEPNSWKATFLLPLGYLYNL